MKPQFTKSINSLEIEKNIIVIMEQNKWNYHVHEELLQLYPTVDTDLWSHCLIEIEVKQKMYYIYPWQSQFSHNFDNPTEKA